MKKALLVIDVQTAITEGKAPHITKTVHHINHVIEQFDGPIIYIRHLEVGSEFDPSDDRSFLSSELIIKSENIIEKYHHSAFYETSLDQLLKSLGVEEVVVVGFQTEYCVDATIKTGHFLGYQMTLLKDCHHTVDGDITKEVLKEHYEKQLSLYGSVIHSMDYLRSR